MAQEDLVIVREAERASRGRSTPKASGAQAGNAGRAFDADMLFTVRRDIILRNGRAGVLMHLLFALVVGLVLYGSTVPKIYVSAWLVTLVAIVLVRLVFIARVAGQDTPEIRPLVGLAVSSGVLIGVGWGLCGLFLFLGLDTAQTVVVILAMFGAMFGAATNGARLWVFGLWIAPTVAPLIVYAAVTPGLAYTAVAATFLLVCVAMTRAAHNVIFLFKRSASLVRSIQRADRRLRDSARRFKIIADHSHDWESWFDRQGRLVWTSPSVERFTGYSAEEVMLNPVLVLVDAIHPDDRARMNKAIEHGAAMATRGEVEFRVIHKDGTVRWCNSVSNPIVDETGAVEGFRASVRDISVQKRLEADLEQLASVDSLTGLMNRRAFIEKATEEIYRAGRYDKPLVIAILDIDNFKRVNDSYGHAVGDRCLVALADIVRKGIRQSDLFGRFGGEEFVLLLPETELAHGMQLCERLRRRVEITPVDAGDQTIKITTSVGIADFQQSTSSLDDLLARADAALYSAKRNGRNQVAYGDASATIAPPDGFDLDPPRLSRTA